RKLNLLGVQATDATMAILQGMPHLEAVNLYRTRVTNSGLASLQGLKELTDLDLRYSRVTSNGIDALKTARPTVKVQYVGAPSVRSKTNAAARPAGTSDREIADWIKGLGGKATLSGDHI